MKIMICCVCLGDRSDAHNEIVECDGCGVTVHEGTVVNTWCPKSPPPPQLTSKGIKINNGALRHVYSTKRVEF